MKLVSVNVGRPRTIDWRGTTVTTSIFKAPLDGSVRIRRLNIDGDEQSDLVVHGGVDKAVYAYPAEHYAYWREELPGVPLPWGAFGENLTTEGVLEDMIHVGDRIRVGTTELVVTQPRMPCFKLQIRFDRLDMVRRFLRSGRAGFYLRVVQEGEVVAGAALRIIERAVDAPTVAAVTRDQVARVTREASTGGG